MSDNAHIQRAISQPHSSNIFDALYAKDTLSQSMHGAEYKTLASKIARLDQTSLSQKDVLTKSNHVITTNEDLYNSRMQAKIKASEVVTLLDPTYKSKLFDQLDYLLDSEDWNEEDTPLRTSSFSTFLKLITHVKPSRHPGLGISNSGNLIAAWTTDRNRLTIEFFPNDKVRWVLSRYFDEIEEAERSASTTSVLRLLECLAPWNPNIWFYDHE